MRGLFPLHFKMLTRLLRTEWPSGKVPRAFMCHKALYPQSVFSQSASKTPIVPREMYVPLSSCSPLSPPRCWLQHLCLLSPSPSPSPGGLGNFAVPPVTTHRDALRLSRGSGAEPLQFLPACALTQHEWEWFFKYWWGGREGGWGEGRGEKKEGGGIRLQNCKPPQAFYPVFFLHLPLPSLGR